MVACVGNQANHLEYEGCSADRALLSLWLVKAEDHNFIKKSIRHYVGLLTGALVKGSHFLAFCYLMIEVTLWK